MKSKKELTDTKKNIKQIKELYSDFGSALKEVLGDAGDFLSKHKFLVLIAFIIYLWHRNSNLTVSNFVKGLENKFFNNEEGDTSYKW